MTDYDDLVIGAGMGGLTVGALLAAAGRKVLVVEAHDTPGGYAHTFRMKDFRFCAQVHYIFNCGQGESIHQLLDTIGVADEVPFVRLDPEGFDHVVVAGERTKIPNGLGKLRQRLVRRYPEAAEPLRRYFATITTLGEELESVGDIPARPGVELLRSAVRARHVIRYLRWTLEDLYDHVHMPPRLRTILAGQSGDYLLPPRDVSLLLHTALVCGYDRGAYYPKRHFFHFIETIVKTITERGGTVLLEHEVAKIEVEGKRVTGIRTVDGTLLQARRYISNLDPKVTLALSGQPQKKAQRYGYSSSTFNLFLGIRGIDLRDHGFGSHNVWHWPNDDMNRTYDDQLVRHDLSDPWLFLSTPTLHSDEPGLCPSDQQILEVATSCDYGRFARLRKDDRRAYNLEKKRIRERIETILEERYIPGLRSHITMRVTGTPTTNERYCRAPEGNAYGSALVPENMHLERKPLRVLDNLWIVNATAGFPSIAGTVGAGLRLYEELRG